MSNPFRSVADYELFLYSLLERFPSIRNSAIVLVRRGTSLARVSGEIRFDRDIRLIVRERIICSHAPLKIDGYGYEIWQGKQKLCWYDSQGHPNDPDLQSTHPHHKHIPPDMKHHRIPAPEMSFAQPNIPALIKEIDRIVMAE